MSRITANPEAGNGVPEDMTSTSIGRVVRMPRRAAERTEGPADGLVRSAVTESVRDSLDDAVRAV
ncbi:hypothetical protein ACQBAT_06890 [Ornithinimicrobium sp. Y1847]|uniref:hypothetical protein n=1 Tax=unclassified Ornithinimicrobium TaxID=2615080 RepID=UPI003B677359